MKTHSQLDRSLLVCRNANQGYPPSRIATIQGNRTRSQPYM